MSFSFEWSGDGCWDGAAEIKKLNGVELRILNAPDGDRLNNDPLSAIAEATSIGFIFIKLGPPAIQAVREIMVKYIESRQAKIKVKIGKDEVVYEGPLEGKQRDKLLADLELVSKQLKP